MRTNYTEVKRAYLNGTLTSLQQKMDLSIDEIVGSLFSCIEEQKDEIIDLEREIQLLEEKLEQ